jgi:phosphoribosylglycinamide formyltransferase-1
MAGASPLPEPATRGTAMPRGYPVVVLASGRGSNLRALLAAERAGALGGARVVRVCSDRASCGALQVAREAGVETFALNPADFAAREAFDAALFDAVLAVEPALVACAGFMRILSDAAVARTGGRMINIHPSLLPLYPGLKTHARALAAGDAEHGTTVHQVVATVDAGPAIAQARVPVRPGDDAEALAARVLAREHPLLVAVVRAFAEGQLTAGPRGVAWRGNPLHAPLSLDSMDRTLELRI